MASRKDYVQTARLIRGQVTHIDFLKQEGHISPNEHAGRMITLLSLRTNFAAEYAADNARFDAAKFKEAAGV